MITQIYNNITLWFLLVIIILISDYLLIFFIKKIKPKSRNIYYQLNAKFGFLLSSGLRLIFFTIGALNLSSDSKLDQEHGKSLIIIYAIIVSTLIYDSLISNHDNKENQ
jgi:hypothetical protein